jgi:HEAT repeat protein
VRNRVARALGALADPRACDPLVAALGDPDAGVRASAAEALGRLGEDRAVDPLLAAL